jgi:hypothetical protein
MKNDLKLMAERLRDLSAESMRRCNDILERLEEMEQDEKEEKIVHILDDSYVDKHGDWSGATEGDR